ncbi:host specificity factor TipJ family phage tail protein [Orrella sp. JC864]|uniref:host specificity factor TipJ family phage tail protein n=1 Tax=Orrella sp. JC864 TaxID=3120298 RepID=UPI003009A48C
MPSVIIRRDPFRPQMDQQTVTVRRGTRLDTVLRRQGFIQGRGKAIRRPVPFVVQVNGEWLLQARWARRLVADDAVLVVVLPAGGGGSNPLQIVAMVALAAVTAGVGAWAAGAYASAAGVAATSAGALAVGAGAAAAVAIVGGMAINSLFPPARLPSTMEREGASPTYTIGAQGNMARPFEAIPVRYGRYRSYLDFASQPYTEMEGNETYLYQLFMVGQGEYDIERIQIEDTDVGNFSEVQYEVVPPGGRVTLFPDNVVTSSAVQGIELPAAGGPGAGPVGPFVANPAGTRTTELAVDVVLPRGLFYVNYKGALEPLATTFNVYGRQIDDSGQPIGSTVLLGAERLEMATSTPQYRTYRYSVPQGRWEVSVERTSADIPDRETRSALAISWLGLRAYLPSQQDYGDVTLLAMRIRATNNLNQTTARRINVIATRRLRTWHPINGWSAGAVATRNPAWAIADACTNPRYGKGLPTSRINMAGVYRLAQIWDQRGDRFDGVFDTTVTFWEAITQIARVGRAMPIYYAGVIDIVRDEAKSLRTQMFTPANIVARSLSIDYAFPEFDDPDHIIVEFTNEATWQDDEVVCALAGSAMLRPYRLRIPGITNRDHAWREGITLAVRNRDQRRFISFQTEFEGAIPGYADLVEISHDVPKWGLSGWIESFDAASLTLTTSEPLEWYEGENHYISLRRRDGSPAGPYRVVPAGPTPVPPGLSESDLAELMTRRMRLVDVDADDIYVSDGVQDELTHYAFGAGERRALLAQVMSATPDEEGRWTLDAVNYAPSVHVAEQGGDVPPPPPPSLLPNPVIAPIIDSVVVYAGAEPGTQIISATPARGAARYEFEASSDAGQTWYQVGEGERPNIMVRLEPGAWRVRVRGIGVLVGPWATWQGQISANAGPPPALLSLVAEPALYAIRLRWTLPDAPYLRSVEIYESQTPDIADAQLLTEPRVPQQAYEKTGVRVGQRFWYWARLRDEADAPGGWFPDPTGPGVAGQAVLDAGPYLEAIRDEIMSSEQGRQLFDRVEQIDVDLLDLQGADERLGQEIAAEAQARVQQVGQVAKDLAQLGGIVEQNTTGIAELREEGDLHALQVLELRAALGDTDASLTTIRRVQMGAVEQLTRLTVRTDEAVTQITDMLHVLDGQATRLQVLEVEAEGLSTRTQTLEEVTGQYASRFTEVESDLDGVHSAVQTLQQAQEGMATQLETVEATAVGAGAAAAAAQAAVQTEATARADADSALAQSISEVSASVGQNAAAIQQIDQATEEQALRQLQLMAQDGATEGFITEQMRAMATHARQISQLVARNESMQAAIQTIEQVFLDETGALAEQVSTLVSSMTQFGREADAEGDLADVLNEHASRAMIQTERRTRATSELAMARAIESMQASVGTAVALMEQSSEVVAELDGRVSSMMMVRAQVTQGGETVAAGFMIGAEGEGGVLTSRFAVFAQQFVVLDQLSESVVAPFAVEGGQTIIDDALIRRLHGNKIIAGTLDADAITNNSFVSKVASIDTAYVRRANIQELAVDTLRIAGGSVTTGSALDYSFELDRWQSQTVRAEIHMPVGGLVVAMVDVSATRIAGTGRMFFRMNSSFSEEASYENRIDAVAPHFSIKDFFISSWLGPGTHFISVTGQNNDSRGSYFGKVSLIGLFR